MKTFWRYFVALLLILGLGCTFLLLTGLISQDAVFSNIQLSAGQLQQEGYNTELLVRNDETYQLDNFTEARILMMSLYMNARHSPATVLICPTYEGDDVPIEALLDIADTGVQTPADTYFPAEVNGIRGVIRLLLAVMNLRQIRRLVMWVVLLLVVANVITLRRQFSSLIAILFAVSFLCMNPVVVMSSIQYSACFIIAMVAMLCMPYVGRWKKYTPCFVFFLIGGLTQFFDVYTYPIITFGLPMLVLLMTCQRDGSYLRFLDSLKFVGRCLGTWLIAYGAVWLAKVGLTNLLTDFDAWGAGMGMLAGELTIASLAAPFQAVYATVRNVVTIESAVCLILLMVAWSFFLDLRPQRKAGWQQAWIYLVVAALPLITIMGKADHTLTHAYYEYRSLVVMLFGLCCFYCKPTKYLEKYKNGTV